MELKDLNDSLTALGVEIKSKFEAAEKEQKETGKVTTELKTQIENLQKQADAIDKKIAEKTVTGSEQKSFGQILKEDESVSRLLQDKRGRAVITLKGVDAESFLERKTTITTSGIGFATPGILAGERVGGIVMNARAQLRVRDVLSARPTTQPLIYFVKVNSPMVDASPQIETHTKHENAVSFTVATELVKTIATWIPAAKQILDDFAELEGFLKTNLQYAVNSTEEKEMLTGSGSGEHLHGLITQATAFSTALLGSSWTRIDMIARAIEQIAIANEVNASFVVLNTADWWNMKLLKDTLGRYLIGDPQSPTPLQLWGLDVVPTNNIASGTFLVGAGSPESCEIRDRMEMQVEISTEHEDYFARNMVAIRAEKRLALVVYRPASYITGTFNQSPA